MRNINCMFFVPLIDSGLISGPLCRRFGCRPVAMVGGFFAGLGLILAAFAVEVSQLAICLAISGNHVI